MKCQALFSGKKYPIFVICWIQHARHERQPDTLDLFIYLQVLVSGGKRYKF